MPQIKLPKIGLGTMLGMSKKARQAFVKGIDYGYRFLDTAQIYFNERTVGKAIAEASVPRDELIIATKIWISNHKPRRVKKSTERSLKRLQIDAIDILYIHWPWRFHKIKQTLQAMSELIDEGKIKHIAVSNFTQKQIDEALALTDKPIVANQVEMHPWLQQKELLSYLKKQKIHLVAYSPLLRGRFKEIPELNEIAQKHNISSAQVSLAWIISKGAIPIPKSATEKHLKENFDSQKIKLDSKDIKLIDSIQKEKRPLSPPFISTN